MDLKLSQLSVSRSRLVWLFIVLTLFLSACSGPSARPPVVDRGIKPAWVPKYHKVQRGDTLFSIAWRYGKDVSQIARWNRLRSPYTIYINQKLLLSGTDYKVNNKVSSTAKASTSTARNSRSDNRKTQSRTINNKKPIKNNEFNYIGKVKWQWPIEGKILRKYNKNTSGKKGIAIAGRSGAVIHAAAAGKVVYSGSGLVGYGRLIIIMHSKAYLSAYAHNSKLLVKEGDILKAGQNIALMGNSGTQRTMLHFEIRRNGKPVDPLRYLPRR